MEDNVKYLSSQGCNRNIPYEHKRHRRPKVREMEQQTVKKKEISNMEEFLQ
jgi:hypothetical protein